jgi:hypothetical protein
MNLVRRVEAPPEASAKPSAVIQRPQTNKARRPRKPPRPKWVTDSKAWSDDRVFYFVEACEFLTYQLDEISEKATPEERAKLREHWRPEPLLNAMRKLKAKIAAFDAWLCSPKN